MKTVAIVGAGPGGLVAAKTLLRSYPSVFQVTVFEKADRVGGLWNVKNHTRDGYLPPNMPTNLSRFTVGFSDLSWESMRFNNKSPPMFPKAWQVEEYLEEYTRRYLPKDIVSLRSEVTSIEKTQEHSKTRWRLRYSHLETPESLEQTFDYLMIASGFFAKPRPIRCELRAVDVNDPTIKFVHSSKYRSLEDITPKDEKHGKNMTYRLPGTRQMAMRLWVTTSFKLPRGRPTDYHCLFQEMSQGLLYHLTSSYTTSESGQRGLSSLFRSLLGPSL